jgi:uncharacterized protein with HEPN domain
VNARAERALRDMRANARQGLTYAASNPNWPEEQLVIDAIAKRVEQVAEVAKYRFPFELRRAVSGIEWDEIAGMRDRLVHGYERLNLRICRLSCATTCLHLSTVSTSCYPRSLRTSVSTGWRGWEGREPGEPAGEQPGHRIDEAASERAEGPESGRCGLWHGASP